MNAARLKQTGLEGSNFLNLHRLMSSVIQNKARRDRNDYIKKICQDLEDYNACNTELFQYVKKLINSPSSSRPAIIRDEDGSSRVLTESNDIKKRWRIYCENIFFQGSEHQELRNLISCSLAL